MELVELVCKKLDSMSYQDSPSSQKKNPQHYLGTQVLKIYLMAVSIFM